MRLKSGINSCGSCPIDCKYCVITNIDSRKILWEDNTIIGLNKAVTIFNPPFNLSDKEKVDEFYNFPIDLFEGDIVGFNAITDPFWPKYEKELKYFLENISPISKIVTCVTKFPIKEEMMKYLSQFKNFRLIVSITGLDGLEKGTTKSRLKNLELAKKYGVQAFPLIHPYIAGMTDLRFLPALKEMGYDCVDIKGLRYNEKQMGSWMNSESKKYYENTNEEEILPNDGWERKLEKSNLKLLSLKKWYLKTIDFSDKRLSTEDAKLKVEQILEYANITSSDTAKKVIEASINRRV